MPPPEESRGSSQVNSAKDVGVEMLRKVRRLGNHPFDVLHGRHAQNSGDDAHPASRIETTILQSVRALGRRLVQVRAPKTEKDKQERALAQRIARHYDELYCIIKYKGNQSKIYTL